MKVVHEKMFIWIKNYRMTHEKMALYNDDWLNVSIKNVLIEECWKRWMYVKEMAVLKDKWMLENQCI